MAVGLPTIGDLPKITACFPDNLPKYLCNMYKIPLGVQGTILDIL